MERPMQHIFDKQALIGATGTALSVILNNISVIASCVVAVLTAFYMFEKYRKERNARLWAEQDREK